MGEQSVVVGYGDKNGYKAASATTRNTMSLVVPKNFLNETANAVNEVIEGLLLTQPNRLQRLEGHDVVLLNPIPTQQRVQLLSGGGSGHEPCFAGFVGSGMLSGAVCGGVSSEASFFVVLFGISW
jgi:dihydroxyacetone kinase